MGQIERGEKNVTLHTMLTLANHLGSDPAPLVEGLALDTPNTANSHN